MKINLIMFDLPTPIEMSENAPLGDILPDDIRKQIWTAQLGAVNEEGLRVGIDYHPHEGDIVRIFIVEPMQSVMAPSYDVVANEYGETIPIGEYNELRALLAIEGKSLWKLRLVEARGLAQKTRTNTEKTEDSGSIKVRP